MQARTRTFVRGQATPGDLRLACDELGIGHGERFVLAHPEVLDASGDALGPYTRDSDTSRHAALDQYPRTGSNRERVLLAIGEEPGTRDELAQRLALPDSTIDPRVWELKRGGFVTEGQETRVTRAGKPAHILILTQKGQAAVNERRPAPQAPWSPALFETPPVSPRRWELE